MSGEEYFAEFKMTDPEEAPFPTGPWANAWQPVWERPDGHTPMGQRKDSKAREDAAMPSKNDTDPNAPMDRCDG
jgi:hypothetical protein